MEKLEKYFQNRADFEVVLKTLAEQPEQLGVPATYAVTDELRVKQYGRYDAAAVRREGERLLRQTFTLEVTCEAKALRKWQQSYYAWQKKLRELKCKDIVQGEFNERGQIVLYEAAIREKCSLHAWDYLAYSNSVLVHERLHYLHWLSVLQKFGAEASAVQSAEYKAAQAYWFGGSCDAVLVRTVKEVLAEFGRYVWCVAQGQEALTLAVTERLQGARAFAPSYPYAAVRELCALYASEPDVAVRAYGELWRASLRSWQEAWRQLTSFLIL